jgi:pimeloyl-ACP methyl ester carboxylesterase
MRMSEDERQGGRGCGRGCMTALLAGALVVVVLAVAGMVYESVTSARAWEAHPPPGEMVDAGGYRLHLHTMGEARGQPTVILDHGGMSMSLQWGWVQPELARHTRVVAYDRPGMGWSEPAPGQLEAEEAVDDLRAALRQAGIEGPYVLVGHSMGALMVRTFAARYPDEVAGLVLVDPRFEAEEGSPAMGGAGAQVFARILSVVGRLGIVRITGLAEQEAEGLPPEQVEQAVALFPSHRFLRNVGADGYLGDSAEVLLRATPPPEGIPVTIVAATGADGAFNPEQRAEMNAHYRNLAARSPLWSYREVEGAGHATIVTHEEPARVVAGAVLEMVNEVAGEQ